MLYNTGKGDFLHYLFMQHSFSLPGVLV